MSEVIYMYRRKGQDAWATCDESRYLELGGSHLFEVRIIHTGNEYAALSTLPQPAAVEVVEAVGYVMSDAEYLRTDGKAGRVIWFGKLEPGSKLYTHRATVPAGCKVVPVELLRRVCRDDGASNDMAMEELRALLASAEGVKDE